MHCARSHNGRVAQASCLALAQILACHRPYLAVEVHFPEKEGLWGQGAVVVGREDGRDKPQVQARIEGNEDGTCTLHLEFNDATSPLLRLSLLVPNQERAAAMSRRFREDPAACYHQIIQILSKEQEESL